MSDRDWFPPGGSWFKFPSFVLGSMRHWSAEDLGVLMELAMGCWQVGGPVPEADIGVYVSDPTRLATWEKCGAAEKGADGWWCPWLTPSLRTLKNRRGAALENLETARQSPKSEPNTVDESVARFGADSGPKSPSLSSSVVSSSKSTTKRGGELRAFLGDAAGVVDGLDAHLGPDWAAAVMGLFGPSGTWQHCYPGRKANPTILGSALNSLLAEPKPSFRQNFIAKLIETAGRGTTKAEAADETHRVADARHESQARDEARAEQEEAKAEAAKKAARAWYDALPAAERKTVRDAAELRAVTMAQGFGSRKPTDAMKRAAFIAECQERMARRDAA